VYEEAMMPRGRPRKNPNDVLIKSAELIGWALGGIEREIVETKQKLSALTAQADELRRRVVGAGLSVRGPAAAAADAKQRGGRGGRRHLTAEARRAISERMTRLWAERRKAKAAGR
jgi:hypothetical protein